MSYPRTRRPGIPPDVAVRYCPRLGRSGKPIGMLGGAAVVGSLVPGAVLMASPVVLLLIEDRPYFRQDR